MITSRCATEFVTRTLTVIHEIIHSSSAVLRKDETYGFVYFKANSSFEAFRKDAQQTMDTFHQPQAAELDTDNRDDTMHGSVLPWLDFTSFEHAAGMVGPPSIPKLVFGKVVPFN